jgi:hypothetical protein
LRHDEPVGLGLNSEVLGEIDVVVTDVATVGVTASIAAGVDVVIASRGVSRNKPLAVAVVAVVLVIDGSDDTIV